MSHNRFIKNKPGRRVIFALLPLLVLAPVLAALFSVGHASAKTYGIGGASTSYTMQINLTGSADRVASVRATRTVATSLKVDNVYTLSKDKKIATRYTQQGFDFGQYGQTCEDVKNDAQNGNAFPQDAGWFSFKVEALDSSGTVIASTPFQFDKYKDCAHTVSKNLDIGAAGSVQAPTGTLNGTITMYYVGKEVGVSDLQVQIKGPKEGDNKSYFATTTSADKKSFTFSDLTPGTYTLTGTVRCGGDGCDTSAPVGTINTTGAIKAGANKNDIIINNGLVGYCGDGCDKATAINNLLTTDSVDGGDAGVDTDNSPEANCENGAGAFGWALCPIFDGMSNTTKYVLHNVIEPMLETRPVTTSTSSAVYSIWSGFRLYGNIFLVIALLVIVFGQSIGGGMVDAYTAKKVLPRLLAAAILINLSIYLVNFAIDITNIMGVGITDVITKPVSNCTPATAGTTCWDFRIKPDAGLGVLGLGLIGLVGTVGGILGALVALFTGGAGAIAGMIFFTMLPIILAVVAVFFTLILRQGIIVLLIIVSPVAFALYCLPNTEQYFRKWWDALFKTLLVYPIVMTVFAVCGVLSITTLQAGGVTPNSFDPSVSPNFFTTHTSSILATITAFALQFLPLFLIPFAFRIAGGLLGRLHGAITGAGEKLNQSGLIKRKREQSKANFEDIASQGQERGYRALAGRADKGGIGGFAAKRMANRVRTRNGLDITEARAHSVANMAKRMDAITSSGDDRMVRALTVNKSRIDRDKRNGVGKYDAETNKGDWRTDSEGKTEYRTLGGAWVKESDVNAANKEFGSNQAALQAATTYEMRKATEEGNVDHFRENYQKDITDRSTRLGTRVMSDGQSTGILKGAAFANQGTHRFAKYWSADSKGNLALSTKGAADLSQEVADTQGGYDLLRSNPEMAREMTTKVRDAGAIKRDYEAAQATGGTSAHSEADYREAQRTLLNSSKIAASLRSQAMSPGPGGDPSSDDASAAGAAALRSGGGGRSVGSGASAHGQEEWNKFVAASDQNGGVYQFPSISGPSRTPPPNSGSDPGGHPGNYM
ncbi:MAG: rane protein of unknown function [Candidatus Saccharibacteria bacterium]|nr:rane protein of unknown function [Candidatus Saccharibacteria bacterium]